jgi:predicted membrane-bound spermidine synthase
MKKLIPQNFNDLLCLILVFAVIAVWIVQGLCLVTLSAEVTGALIVTWTLVVQFYFRRTPDKK